MPHGKGMLGGHVVQIEKTARALGQKGVAAVTDFSDDPPLTDIDLVHGFGLNAAQIRRCHTRRVPVALSPIYWDRSYRAEGPPRKLGARSTGRARIPGRPVRPLGTAGPRCPDGGEPGRCAQ